MTFRLLHVCTGNICRSPMAERLTRAGLEARSAADAFVYDRAFRRLRNESYDPRLLAALDG